MARIDQHLFHHGMRVLHDIWLSVFKAIIITIFSIAWLVEGGPIALPPWTKELSLLTRPNIRLC